MTAFADRLRAVRWWVWVILVLLTGALVSSPWWLQRAASELAFFRVRRVDVRGTRYLDAAPLVARLRIDTTFSIWSDLRPLEERVAVHPQVRTVHIGRKLPGTLVLTIEETSPVAYVPTPSGMRAYDALGRALPLDPSRVAIDLPILARRDTTLLRLLDDLRETEPVLFARINEVRRVGSDEVWLQLVSYAVRAMLDVHVDRLREIVPVEADLAKRRARVAELDLRFKDQVIARLQ